MTIFSSWPISPSQLLPLEMGGADPDPSGDSIPDYDDYSDGGSSDD
jgi:hypothetical protein